MDKVGLVLPDELYDIDIRESIRLAVAAEKAGFHSVWKGETSGSNSFMLLSAIAQQTDSIKLGTAIANVYSRSPALLGMSAATLDRLSDGRGVLGLGVSSPTLVEEWHGADFTSPLRRLRETIEIVHQIVDGGELNYHGKIHDVGPYSVGLPAESESMPIFNAAMGRVNRKLTGEYADGWIPIFVPASRMREFVDEIESAAKQEGRERPTMAPWIPFAMAEDHDRATKQARLLIAQEMAMGYNNLVDKYGFGDEGDLAFQRWRDGDREAAAEAISDEMLAEFAIYGTPEECLSELRTYKDRGVDIPILWLPFSASASELTSVIELIGSEFA